MRGFSYSLARLSLVLMVCVSLLNTSFATDAPSRAGKPALPGEACQTAPHPDWTSQEQWVWMQVCEGKIVNFNTAKGYGGWLDPKEAEHWPEMRILRPVFLETILLYEPFRSILPHQGVRIIGAWFKESLDLSNVTLAHRLWLGRSRFESNVDLGHLKTSHVILLDGSVVMGNLNMNSIWVNSALLMRGGARFNDVELQGARIESQFDLSQATVTGKLNMGGMQVDSQLNLTKTTVKGNLNMNSIRVSNGLLMYGGSSFAEVDLRRARIESQLDLSQATVTGKLNMNGLEVTRSLLMREGAQFADVDLINAKIGGQLSMIKARVTGKLNMNSLEVTRSLLMREGAQFADVDLINAKIGGQLSIIKATVKDKLDMRGIQVGSGLLMRERAKFAEVDLRGAKIEELLDLSQANVSGKLNMDRIQVRGPLLMRGTTFTEEKSARSINVLFATIDADLDLSGASLPSLDLTGTTIGGELRLTQGSFASAWLPGAQLILRDTKVGTLQGAPAADTLAAWPDTLELRGFTYDRLGGFTVKNAPAIAASSVALWKDWLQKQQKYTPQPYEHLAKVLRDTGYQTEATKILYASKKREHAGAPWGRWLWATLLWLTIGYGYYPWYALVWAILFIVFGMGVLWWSGQDREYHLKYLGLAYSVDMFLPIIQLRKLHHDLDLQGWPRGYFYVHKTVGYVLALFLVAALSGLTK